MLLHLANLVVLGSYLVRDILLLRVIAVAASGCFISYFMTQDPPGYEAAAWNVVYVLVNGVQIAILVRERMAGKLTREEAALRERVFPFMPPHKFAKFVRLAQPCALTPEDGALVEAGARVDWLWLVLDGTLEVRTHDRVVASCTDGDFIGEMAFIDQSAASARVSATRTVRMLSWSVGPLRSLLEREPDIQRELHAAIGLNMAQKLRRKATADRSEPA